MKSYTLHFDGSCGPKNPGGTAAYGFLLTSDGEELERGKGVIGSGPKMSNNLAEFAALGWGMIAFCSHHDRLAPGTKAALNVYGDSNLVIQVMNRFWRATADKLYYPAYLDCVEILKNVRRAGHVVTFDHIPRKQNQECDSLSKAYQCVSK